MLIFQQVILYLKGNLQAVIKEFSRHRHPGAS